MIFPFCNIEDDAEYNAAVISGQWGHHNSSKVEFSLLSNLKFELNDSYVSLTLYTNHCRDADINHFNALLNSPSEYCESSALETIITTPQQQVLELIMNEWMNESAMI